MNHTKSNKPIPDDSKNIGLIHDSDNICAIDKILASLVHSLVHTSRIFTYGSASDPPPPPHESPEESVTPRGNPKPFHNPPNLVPNLTAEPDSGPNLSDYYLSESYDSSDKEYYKQRRRLKKDKNKLRSKTCFDDPIKKYADLIAKLLTAACKSKVIRFKLGEDKLQQQVYLLSFISSV